MSEKGDAIRAYITANVRAHPKAIVAVTAEKFGITRQSAHYHVSNLVDEKILTASGETQARVYELEDLDTFRLDLDATEPLEEDRVWTENLPPKLEGYASQNVSDICFYGFTEMLNNAMEHSAGSLISVIFVRTAADLRFWINDDGVGIFNKIAAALSLSDPRLSLLELSKGKFTTDPEHHTGEGIFFTSRVFERFAILSQTLCFLHERDSDDWLVQHKGKDDRGTSVMMQIDLAHTGTLKETFDRFSGGEAVDYGFTKTHVPLKLALIGESNLISRSQAKRVLSRFDRFEEIMLDFAGINMIGQSFADEIFRVFARQNPRIKLIPVRANPDVLQMIQRAQSHTEIAPDRQSEKSDDGLGEK